MVDELEILGGRYDVAREKLIQAIANRIDSLVDKMSENKVGDDIFICELCGETSMRQHYHITSLGLHDRKAKVRSTVAAYNMLDFCQTKDIIYYLSRAEKQICKGLAQKQNQELSDNLDFSNFFNRIEGHIGLKRHRPEGISVRLRAPPRYVDY